MEEEIKKIIETQLPAQTAGVLRDFILKAENSIKQLEQLKENNKLLSAEVESLRKLESQINSLNSREKAVSDKEDSLWKKEIEQQLSIEKIRYEESEKRVSMVFDLARCVFKNPTVRYSESGNTPVVVPAGINNSGYMSSACYDKTIQQTLE